MLGPLGSPPMALSDLSPLTYFKELHLLPRVIFTIGGAFFFGGLFSKDWRVLLFGAGLVFVSLGYNFFADLIWNEANPPHTTRISWSNLFQGLLALTIGASILYVVVYNYRHGFLPTFLRPLK
jgi:hypothetical protein